MKNILFFIFLHISISSLAQEKMNFIEAKLHVGKVINNYLKFDSFPKTKPLAIVEFSMGKQTTGTKNWQQYYGFPIVGVSMMGGYLGNNSQFGLMLGTYPYVTLNTINKNKWSAKLKLGLGMGYFNRPFDSLSNPYNILIGSHFTALGVANLHFQRSLTENLKFEFGVSVFHASNGHTGLPNVGLNTVNINSGFKYYIDKQSESFNKNSEPIDKKVSQKLQLGIGTHKFGNELGPVNGSSYNVYDAAYYIGKPIGKLGTGMIGIAYKYYNSYYNKIKEGNIYEDGWHLKSSVLTLLLAYEFEMGQMSLIAQGGISVYHPFWKEFVRLIGSNLTLFKKIEGIIPTRLGLQYYLFDKEKFNNNAYIGLYINANFGGADFVSVSTGFKF